MRITPRIKKTIVYFSICLISCLIIGLFYLLSTHIYVSENISPIVISPQILSPENDLSIQMYKEIAEQAITTSTKTIELMKWLILSVIGVSTGIVGYIFKALKDTDEQTKKLREELLVSVNKLGEAQKQFEAMTSHFNLLQHELIDQTSVFVSQEFAIDAFEKGKITEKQLIESQIWFTWSKWRYSDSNEGYQELVGCKESNGLPDSIRRVAIIELDNLQHAVKTRGIITTHEKDLRLKLLDLLDFVPLTNL